MVSMQNTIEEFFKRYETTFNESLAGAPKADATAEAFTDDFLAVSPQGVAPGKNDERFREAIAQGYGYYRAMGTESMRIAALETTPLDDYHTMVRVSWLSQYRRLDIGEVAISFDNVYLVRTVDGVSKIFAYITGDEQKTLREKGIIE